MKKKTTAAKILEDFFLEGNPTYDFLFRVLEQLKNEKLILSDRENIQNSIKLLLSFFNDKRNISPYSKFRIKKERITPIQEESFLYFLCEYLVFKQLRPSDIRKWSEIYRTEKNAAYKSLDFIFLPDGVHHQNETLHDFTGLFMYDRNLGGIEVLAWSEVTCVSVESSFKICRYFFKNILGIDFVNFDAFKKSLIKYRKMNNPNLS